MLVPSNVGGEPSTSWDVFGVTSAGTAPHIDRGWLTCETVVQFKLHSAPVTFWKEKLTRRTPLLKLTPVSLNKQADTGCADVGEMLENSLSLDTHDNAAPSEAWPITEVAVSSNFAFLLLVSGQKLLAWWFFLSK